MKKTLSAKMILPVCLAFIFLLGCTHTPSVKTKAIPASLAETYWKFVEMSGQPVEPGTGEKELHLILSQEKNQAKGFSGCNTFFGTYKQKDDQLTFGPLASTRMAGPPENMEQEQHFLKALGDTEQFVIEENILTLLNAGNQPVLRFEAGDLQ